MNGAQCKIVVYFLYGCNNGTPTFHYCTDNVGGIVRMDCALDLDSAFTV